MDWEVLIPLLMFAFPVVVSLLDKRAKRKRAASPPPVSRPTYPARPARPAIPPFSRQSVPPGPLPRKRPATPDPSQPFGWAPPSYGAEGGTVSLGRAPEGTAATSKSPVSHDQYVRNSLTEEMPVEEGVRAIHREETEKVPEPVQPADKLKIDKKKLIIYSEILKPKFDA